MEISTGYCQVSGIYVFFFCQERNVSFIFVMKPLRAVKLCFLSNLRAVICIEKLIILFKLPVAFII